MKKKLTIIANTPSINTKLLLNQTALGAKSIQSDLIDVQHYEAFKADHNCVLNSSGIIIGTTENLGYMSGMIKDFFDRIYYECLEKTEGLPYAIYIRAGHDGTSTDINIKKIITGLKWKQIQKPVILKGDWNKEFSEQCYTLGATMAAGIESNIY
jgi:multimeric flavodoxin WrbA